MTIGAWFTTAVRVRWNIRLNSLVACLQRESLYFAGHTGAMGDCGSLELSRGKMETSVKIIRVGNSVFLIVTKGSNNPPTITVTMQECVNYAWFEFCLN